MNDIIKSDVLEFSGAAPGLSFLLLTPVIGQILLTVLGVVLLVNINIFLILKIKRMRKEDREG